MPPKRKSTTAPTSDDPPHWKPGSQVEISSNDPGFRGSWYAGKIVKRCSTRNSNNMFLVQYTNLFQDDAGTKPLKETINAADLRPPAPRERARKFKFGEEVDADHHDGWWEGVITKELENGKFHVYFKRSKEQLEFGEDQLRLHREWVNGSWEPPLEEEAEQVEEEVPKLKDLKTNKGKGKEKMSNNTLVENDSDKNVTEGNMVQEVVKGKEVKPNKGKTKQKMSNNTIIEKNSEKGVTEGKMESEKAVTQKKLECVNVATKEKLESDKAGSGQKLESSKITEEKFSEGARVEVRSNESGFEGAWFAGTIVKAMGKDRYLVQYESLRTEDDTDFLKEEFDILNIRPCPPEIVVPDGFKKLDEVDALYNDGWWVGVILKVLPDSTYVVYFADTKEEMKFEYSHLRLHQDWIAGKWVAPFKALNS